jgi:hypothetical protein
LGDGDKHILDQLIALAHQIRDAEDLKQEQVNSAVHLLELSSADVIRSIPEPDVHILLKALEEKETPAKTALPLTQKVVSARVSDAAIGTEQSVLGGSISEADRPHWGVIDRFLALSPQDARQANPLELARAVLGLSKDGFQDLSPLAYARLAQQIITYAFSGGINQDIIKSIKILSESLTQKVDKSQVKKAQKALKSINPPYVYQLLGLTHEQVIAYNNRIAQASSGRPAQEALDSIQNLLSPPQIVPFRGYVDNKVTPNDGLPPSIQAGAKPTIIMPDNRMIGIIPDIHGMDMLLQQAISGMMRLQKKFKAINPSLETSIVSSGDLIGKGDSEKTRDGTARKEELWGSTPDVIQRLIDWLASGVDITSVSGNWEYFLMGTMMEKNITAFIDFVAQREGNWVLLNYAKEPYNTDLLGFLGDNERGFDLRNPPKLPQRPRNIPANASAEVEEAYNAALAAYKQNRAAIDEWYTALRARLLGEDGHQGLPPSHLEFLKESVERHDYLIPETNIFISHAALRDGHLPHGQTLDALRAQQRYFDQLWTRKEGIDSGQPRYMEVVPGSGEWVPAFVISGHQQLENPALRSNGLAQDGPTFSEGKISYTVLYHGRPYIVSQEWKGEPTLTTYNKEGKLVTYQFDEAFTIDDEGYPSGTPIATEENGLGDHLQVIMWNWPKNAGPITPTPFTPPGTP